MEKHHHWLGVSGGSGVGYGAPAAVGAALANRKYGRLTINIQSDGDLSAVPIRTPPGLSVASERPMM